MHQNIIYQVEEGNQKINSKQTFKSKKVKYCEWLCKMASQFFLKKKIKQRKYLFEIDSPKNNIQITRKTLVLDLDETLVHSTFKDDGGEWDFKIEVLYLIFKIQGYNLKVYVFVRPGAKEFIEIMSQYYEIVIFTASIREYADPVINIIDPEGKSKRRMFREDCVNYQGSFVKDLRVLEKDLSSVIIIDVFLIQCIINNHKNSESSFKFQPDNGLQIKEFFSDKNDSELKRLEPFLIWLSQINDVRPTWKQHLIFQQMDTKSELSDKNSAKYLEFQYQQYEDQHCQSISERHRHQGKGSHRILLQQIGVVSSSREEKIPQSTQKQLQNRYKAKVQSKTMQIERNIHEFCEEEVRLQLNLNSPTSAVIQSKSFNFQKQEVQEQRIITMGKEFPDDEDNLDLKNQSQKESKIEIQV